MGCPHCSTMPLTRTSRRSRGHRRKPAWVPSPRAGPRSWEPDWDVYRGRGDDGAQVPGVEGLGEVAVRTQAGEVRAAAAGQGRGATSKYLGLATASLAATVSASPVSGGSAPSSTSRATMPRMLAATLAWKATCPVQAG